MRFPSRRVVPKLKCQVNQVITRQNGGLYRCSVVCAAAAQRPSQYCTVVLYFIVFYSFPSVCEFIDEVLPHVTRRDDRIPCLVSTFPLEVGPLGFPSSGLQCLPHVALVVLYSTPWLSAGGSSAPASC